ncbi:MAG: sigma-70 family RNA polymerase sigma factor [Thermoanaerobaculia bacterium]
MPPSLDPCRQRFDDLVRRYGGLIRGVVRRVGGAAAAERAEDIEQRILIELWKQVAREQPIDFPSSYLYRAAVRETVRTLRRARARPEEPLEEGGPVEHAADSDPETLAHGHELGALVEREIQSLAPDRGLAVRRHLAGYGVREIMMEQAWSYQKARNLIARGMADLRRALRARGVDG